MAEQKVISGRQRAENFSLMTRQNEFMLPQKVVTDYTSQLQWIYPKARLLSKTVIHTTIELEINNTGATPLSLTSIALDDVFPFAKMIRRFSLDLNNGFSPFVISGDELLLLNQMNVNNEFCVPNSNSAYHKVVRSTDSVSAGAKATVTADITFELQNAMNDKEPLSLILLQNAETNITLTMDIANPAQASFLGATIAPFVTLKKMTVKPLVETFTIPVDPDAYPDISVIKIVNTRMEQVYNGQNIIKLQTGTIYRRLMILFDDMSVDDITSTFELVFNQADTNYSVDPKLKQAINQKMYGWDKARNALIFDFSTQGLPNLGGTRDYIDTEKLTEFWLRFTSAKVGSIRIVAECITKLA